MEIGRISSNSSRVSRTAREETNSSDGGKIQFNGNIRLETKYGGKYATFQRAKDPPPG